MARDDRLQLTAMVAGKRMLVSQFHDPKNLVMLLASEARELLHEYRWIPSGEADAYTDDPAARVRVECEIADVGIALLNRCVRLDIDLPRVVRAKLAVIRQNYPVEAARGVATRPPRDSR